MSNIFENFPSELFERIAIELDLESLRNIRQVSRNLAAGFSGPRFLSFLAVQDIDLSEDSFKRVAEIARHAIFGKIVTTLKITEIIYDTQAVETDLSHLRKSIFDYDPKYWNGNPEEEEKILTQDLKWLEGQRLAQQARNRSDVVSSLIRVLNSLPGLLVIEVNCATCRSRGKISAPYDCSRWRLTYETVQKSLETVLAALPGSKVAIESVIVGMNWSGCGVPLVDMNSNFEACVPNWRSSHNLSSIKKLHMSTTPKLEDEYKDPYGYRSINSTESAYEVTEASFRGLIEALGKMDGLEDLKLHLFRTYLGRLPSEYKLFFSLLTSTMRCRKLKKCILHGVPVTQQAMSELLTRCSELEYLELEKVRMDDGSWKPVLEQMGSMAQLQTLKLSYVSDSTWSGHLGLVDEIIVGKEWGNWHVLPKGRDGWLLHSRTFGRDQIREGFRFAPEPPGNTPQMGVWTERRRRYHLSYYGPQL